MNRIIEKYKHNGNRIILSLTTTPNRIQFVPFLLENLVDTRIFDKIIVNVPRYYKNNKHEKKYQSVHIQDKRVVINTIASDLGPISKIVPTAKLFDKQEDLIVTIDDDIRIPKNPNIMSQLVYHCILYDEVITSVGKPLSHWRLSRKQWTHRKPPYVQLVEGWTGVAYKRKMIDINVLQSYVNKSVHCYVSDDLLLSFMIQKLGYKIRSLGVNEKIFKEMHWGLGDDAIHLQTTNEQAHFSNYKKCLSTLKF